MSSNLRAAENLLSFFFLFFIQKGLKRHATSDSEAQNRSPLHTIITIPPAHLLDALTAGPISEHGPTHILIFITRPNKPHLQFPRTLYSSSFFPCIDIFRVLHPNCHGKYRSVIAISRIFSHIAMPITRIYIFLP